MSKKRTTFYGRCFLCGYSTTKGGLTRHLKKHIADRQGDTPLVWLRVMDRAWASAPSAYWLDLEVPADLALTALDGFLRAIWLECCGHLSHFSVRYQGRRFDFRYNPWGDEDLPTIDEALEWLQDHEKESAQLARAWSNLTGFPEEIARQIFEQRRDAFPIEVSIYGVTVGDMAEMADQWDYEYDYGSTTYLRIQVMARYQGPAPDPEEPIRILSRNYKPDIRCAQCDAPAEYWDPEDGTPWCAEHLPAEKAERALPIVNSPRTGVCAYDGPYDPDLQFEEVYLPRPKK